MHQRRGEPLDLGDERGQPRGLQVVVGGLEQVELRLLGLTREPGQAGLGDRGAGRLQRRAGDPGGRPRALDPFRGVVQAVEEGGARRGDAREAHAPLDTELDVLGHLGQVLVPALDQPAVAQVHADLDRGDRLVQREQRGLRRQRGERVASEQVLDLADIAAQHLGRHRPFGPRWGRRSRTSPASRPAPPPMAPRKARAATRCG